MEDKIPSHGQDADKCEISELKLYWNKCLDSERCDSIELNPVIRQQIQQNILRDTEKSFSPTGQQLLKKYTLSPHKTRTQNSTFKEEYEHRIWILETQKAEQSKDKFTLELHNIKDENYILKKLNHFLRKRNDNYESEIKRLNKVLLQATTTGKINSISTTANPSIQAMTSEEFKTKNEVLMQQVKIYEEDFERERAEKEMIRKEKEELQQIIQKLRIQLQIKPDYQWYVPGQLPPDVKQKDTGQLGVLVELPDVTSAVCKQWDPAENSSGDDRSHRPYSKSAPGRKIQKKTAGELEHET